MLQTAGHKFHVHEKPVAALYSIHAENCQAKFTGGHYNPLEIDSKVGLTRFLNSNLTLLYGRIVLI